MIKLQIRHAFNNTIHCGKVVKIWGDFELGLENILRFNLNFSTSYGRSTD